MLVPGILALLLVCNTASAQNARQLFDKSVLLISQARFDESLVHLNRAREATRDPGLLGRIHLYLGINHSILGDRPRADTAFRKALQYDPGQRLAPNRIKASIVQQFDAIRASMTGELVVEADLPGAEVLLDGKKVGVVPLTRQLPVGTYRVQVRGPDGGPAHQQQVIIGHRQQRRVKATLKIDTSSPTRIWTWVAVGTAAAALGVAIGLGVSAKADNDEYWKQETAPDQGQTLESSGSAKQLGSNVMFGVAGALAVGAVVLFFVEGRTEKAATRQGGLQLLPGPNPGVVFSTSF